MVAKHSTSNPKSRIKNPKSQQSPWLRTVEPLLWLGGAGHETRTPADNYFFDTRKRKDQPHIVLQLTLGGAGFYERGGKRILLKPGMAFFDMIPGNFRYGYPQELNEPYEQVYITMTGSVAQRWWKRITRAFGTVLNFGSTNPIAPLLLAVVRQYQEKTLRDRYLASAQLYQVLMTVLSTLNQSRAATSPLVNSAIAIIDQRGRDPSFNVSVLAGDLGCSREYLSRQFRSSMGVTPLDYVTQHRVRLAAAAIRSGSGKLDVVAQRCGFAGANYLCRVFRQQYGLTPMEFRKRPWMLA
jgi:AraC-like DNA-binding protein